MPEIDEPQLGPRFRGILALEGIQTSDGRLIGENETGWRQLPLTLMALTKSSHGGMPSTETEYAGRIDLIERRRLSEVPASDAIPADLPGETLAIYYEGTFDTAEVGMHTAGLVERQVLRGISIDFAATEDVQVVEEDEDGWPTEVLVTYTGVEIGMATACPFPAFAGCYIELAEGAEGLPEDEGPVDVAAAEGLRALNVQPCVPCGSDRGEVTAVTAAGGPVEPPAAWFEDPQLTGYTPVRIDDDGRIFGHLAPWGECHVGIDGMCRTPPRSASNYAHFRLGTTHTAEGTRVPTGVLFMGTDHASTRGGLSVAAVQDHYANTGQATADVAAGEDAHGIWIAGAMRPGLTPEQVRAARGSTLSGDWRGRGSRLELVAALHVNVPGFPVRHAELVASAAGDPVALVAAGARASSVLADRERQEPGANVAALIRAELQAALAPLLAPLTASRAAEARSRVRGSQSPTADPAAAAQAARARITAARS